MSWQGKVLYYAGRRPGESPAIIVQVDHIHEDGERHLALQFPGELVRPLLALLTMVVEKYPGQCGDATTAEIRVDVRVPTGDPRMN
jgi:hypothetical protein